jgi:hypothetical protein
MAPRRAAATAASKKINQSKGGTVQASTATPKPKKRGTPKKSTPTSKVKKSTPKKKAKPKKQASVMKVAETEQYSMADRERVQTEQFGDFVVYSFAWDENRAKSSVPALISLRVRHADTGMWKIYEDDSKLTKAEVAREKKAGFRFPDGFVTRIQPWDHLVKKEDKESRKSHEITDSKSYSEDETMEEFLVFPDDGGWDDTETLDGPFQVDHVPTQTSKHYDAPLSKAALAREQKGRFGFPEGFEQVMSKGPNSVRLTAVRTRVKPYFGLIVRHIASGKSKFIDVEERKKARDATFGYPKGFVATGEDSVRKGMGVRMGVGHPPKKLSKTPKKATSKESASSSRSLGTKRNKCGTTKGPTRTRQMDNPFLNGTIPNGEVTERGTLDFRLGV